MAVLAVRIGSLQQQTSWILRHFKAKLKVPAFSTPCCACAVSNVLQNRARGQVLTHSEWSAPLFQVLSPKHTETKPLELRSLFRTSSKQSGELSQAVEQFLFQTAQPSKHPSCLKEEDLPAICRASATRPTTLRDRFRWGPPPCPTVRHRSLRCCSCALRGPLRSERRSRSKTSVQLKSAGGIGTSQIGDKPCSGVTARVSVYDLDPKSILENGDQYVLCSRHFGGTSMSCVYRLMFHGVPAPQPGLLVVLTYECCTPHSYGH